MNSRLPFVLGSSPMQAASDSPVSADGGVPQPGAQREGFVTRMDLTRQDFTLRVPYRIHAVALDDAPAAGEKT